jgi:ParB-like chromosome segregation protein Spo0J
MSVVSHQQLAMFMPAHELNKIPMMDAPNYSSRKDMITSKLRDNAVTGLQKSIQNEGVQKPVDVYHDDSGRYLQNGHHRVIGANKVNPNMLVPVEHHDDNDTQYQRSKAPLL